MRIVRNIFYELRADCPAHPVALGRTLAPIPPEGRLTGTRKVRRESRLEGNIHQDKTERNSAGESEIQGTDPDMAIFKILPYSTCEDPLLLQSSTGAPESRHGCGS